MILFRPQHLPSTFFEAQSFLKHSFLVPTNSVTKQHARMDAGLAKEHLFQGFIHYCVARVRSPTFWAKFGLKKRMSDKRQKIFGPSWQVSPNSRMLSERHFHGVDLQT